MNCTSQLRIPVSKQWQQIVLQQNVAAVIQGIQGEKKKKEIQAEVSMLSRPRPGIGTKVFQSASEMLKIVFCISQTLRKSFWKWA